MDIQQLPRTFRIELSEQEMYNLRQLADSLLLREPATESSSTLSIFAQELRDEVDESLAS